MQPSGKTDIDSQRGAADDEIAQASDNQLSRDHVVPQTIVRLTVVIPLHNEAENIKAVVTGLLAKLEAAALKTRVFLVDDGSTDDSLSIVRAMAAKDMRIGYISFSRNFGKEAALMAGLRECGDDFDALAYMDSDGQHTATDLLRLVAAAQDPEADLVCGVRMSRDYQTARQQRMTRSFYSLFRLLSNVPIDEGAGDFNVMKPVVVQALRRLREEHPFMKGLVGWVGFRKRLIPITIQPRGRGVAKSSAIRMLRLAFGAILSFSSWPLRFWSAIGMTSSLLAVIYLSVVILQTAMFGRDVPGYATTVVLLLGIGGLQLLSIGIVGEYVARIYDASKNRPLYLIAERG